MKLRYLLFNIGLSFIAAFIAIYIYTEKFAPAHTETVIVQSSNALSLENMRLASLNAVNSGKIMPVDFTYAANISTPTVVHVKNFYSQETGSSRDPFNDFWGDFFGSPRERENRRQGEASGSGVIISSDGYIVTNNHVINNADKLEVTLYDNHTYDAELIGTDPSTDIALIKIDVKGLPNVVFGNSDSANVGEWVLAVGNPFELTSTVTAGIISAKGRNINILREQSRAPIESFIQTDAAVNPGNSGGALVNVNGELIGINTAIATPTGTYAGYSFAVPVNIVKKVVEDLKDFGIVQRAFLGVSIRDIDTDLADDLDLNKYQGAYILSVGDNSGADEAGLREGDIITKVNGTSVKSVAELQEQVSMYRPGDGIAIGYVRNQIEKSTRVTLKNKSNNTGLVEKTPTGIASALGAEFKDLKISEKDKYKVSGGVKIEDIGKGKISSATNIRNGFIITRIDHKKVYNTRDLMELLERKDSGEGVMLEGFYPSNPRKTYYYAFGM